MTAAAAAAAAAAADGLLYKETGESSAAMAACTQEAAERRCSEKIFRFSSDGEAAGSSAAPPRGRVLSREWATRSPRLMLE